MRKATDDNLNDLRPSKKKRVEFINTVERQRYLSFSSCDERHMRAKDLDIHSFRS
jgi:hypothetical protein